MRRKFAFIATLIASPFSLVLLANYPCQAQGLSAAENNDPLGSGGRSLGATLYSEAHKAATLDDASASADTTPPPADDQWHIGLLPYLWFAGVHGYSGAFGHNASVHASPGDLLSHADIGLMAIAEVRKAPFVAPIDLIWLALSDDKARPENQPGIESITFRAGELILTPKVGYQIIDTTKLKVVTVLGLRYCHLGQRFHFTLILHFNPVLYDGFTTSQNWVDGVAGGRIELPLSPKASVTVAGDAGGGQAAPDYQVWELLGYKVKKNLTLDAGYRYLSINYRNNNHLFLYDMINSGAVIGARFYLK